MKKLIIVLSAVLAVTAILSFVGCSKKSASSTASTGGALKYADVELGKTGSDISATIKLLTHRTDMLQDSYTGVTFAKYLTEFNKLYPNIKVEIEGITDYASVSLLRLQGGDWGDIMMIPAIDKKELKNYFVSFGDLPTMEKQIKFATNWEYDNEVYGIPSTGNAQGVLYNKKVFKEAGITKLPASTEEFIADLKLIKEKTNAIPLYTNYAAGWTMGAWDAYIGNNATGDNTYFNQKLLHTKDPFKDYGDGTHPYAVYKILYDAVAGGLTEDDYSTTDWEGSKSMLNNGQIGCMVLGSWAYPQMEAAGENADDIGYMPFPISVNGEQYASAGADYSYGINVNASDDEKQAALIFVKWMTEKSGFSYNEDGLPVAKSSSDTKLDFSGVTFLEDEPAVEGEEDLLNALNADSELNVNNGGNDKIQAIIEHAANGDESFDDIMNEWNQKWTDAQESEGVEITE